MLLPPDPHGQGLPRSERSVPQASATPAPSPVPPLGLSEPYASTVGDGLIGTGAELAPGAGGFATVLRALLGAAVGDPRTRGHIEAHLQDLLLRNAAFARAHARTERDDHYAARIQSLEDRVVHLREELELSELRLCQERQRASVGIESEYRTVQGISPDDVHRVRKRSLIQDLFRANVALAQELEARFGTTGAPANGPSTTP